MDKKNEFMRRAIELSEESVRTGGGLTQFRRRSADKIIRAVFPPMPDTLISNKNNSLS